MLVKPNKNLTVQWLEHAPEKLITTPKFNRAKAKSAREKFYTRTSQFTNFLYVFCYVVFVKILFKFNCPLNNGRIKTLTLALVTKGEMQGRRVPTKVSHAYNNKAYTILCRELMSVKPPGWGRYGVGQRLQNKYSEMPRYKCWYHVISP